LGRERSVKRFAGTLAVCAVFSMLAACATVSLLTEATFSLSLFRGLAGQRVELLAPVFLFASLHLIVDVRRLYDCIFRYRWLIAAFVFVFLVLNRFNLSSIGMYNYFVQPGAGNAYIEPVFGVPRFIRGDEWGVSTPWQLSAQYGDAYGEYNWIIRGTRSDNISTSGLYFAYSALSNALNFGFFLFGPAYGLAIATWGKALLTLLAAFEFFRVVTKDDRFLSFAGAVLVSLSSFYVWWSLTPFHSITNVMIVTVCIYRFLFAKRVAFKLFLGAAIVLSLSNFVCSFYPAWQVPAGYILLTLFVYLVTEHFDAVKRLKAGDWIIVAVALLITVSIVVAVLRDRADYIAAVSETVYPGQRRDTGRYWTAVQSLFFGMQSFLYPFKDVGNPSEGGTFFALCPLSFFAGAYVWWKDKRSNRLILLLNLLTLFFLFYIGIGLPDWLARALLIDRTITTRLAPFVALLQLIVLLSVLAQNQVLPRKKWVGIGSGLFTAAVHVVFCLWVYPAYMPFAYIALIVPLYVLGGYVMVVKSSRKSILFFVVIVVTLTLASSAYVNPIMKGTDAIYSKPAAVRIAELVRETPEAKWIATGEFRLNGFLMACGAPTLTSVNYIPNMGMWEKLDPTGAYAETYNRYHHIFCNLTTGKTKISLSAEDGVDLLLSYEDLRKIGADYVFTLEILETEPNAPLEQVYDEAGVRIYRVTDR
jgi:hypothetical protein